MNNVEGFLKTWVCIAKASIKIHRIHFDKMISYMMMMNIPIRMQQWEHSFFAFFHGFKKLKFFANNGKNKQHHKNQLHTIIKKFISSLQTCYS